MSSILLDKQFFYPQSFQFILIPIFKLICLFWKKTPYFFFVYDSPFIYFLSSGFYLSFAFLLCLRGENYHRLHCVTVLNNLSFKMQIGDLNTCSQKQTCFPSKNRTRFNTQCFPLSFITACNPPSMTCKMKKTFLSVKTKLKIKLGIKIWTISS